VQKTILKSSIVISLMTFISRILGLIRDIVIAKFFGASLVTDTFFIAFKIPNFFRRLFAEGAFSQAFVPILTKIKTKENTQEVQTVINVIGSKLLFVLVITTIIAIILAPLIIFIFASGFYNTPKFDLTVTMLRITFPYLLFISLTAFLGAILNTYNRFASVAFTPVLLNITIIGFAVFVSPQLEQPIIALAWGVFFGGLAQLLFQIPFIIKIKKLPKITTKTHPQVSIFKKRLIPALFGVGASQLNLLLDMVLASYLVTGSISWLYYANRLFEFPIALLGVALATASLPSLSKYFINKDKVKFKENIDNNLKLSLILGLPAAVGLILLAQPLLTTLFQYDSFTSNDVKQSSVALSAYAIGLLGFIFIKILASVFFAQGDTKTPVKVGIIAIITNIFFNLILIIPFQHLGLAIATSISALTNAALLYYYLHKNNIYRLNKSLIFLFFKVIIASAFMAIVLFYFETDYKSWLDANLYQRIQTLSINIVSAVVSYFVILFILRVKLK
jgi:putative peptidoglycan lipid II flippase